MKVKSLSCVEKSLFLSIDIVLQLKYRPNNAQLTVITWADGLIETLDCPSGELGSLFDQKNLKG